MSSCLSGGGRAAYGFDLEIIKSPSSTSTIRTASHNTNSPSSTLSESNSPLTISTRKPRTARKRPNQTYNEAAALLSTAYPSIFSTKNIRAKKSSSNLHPTNFLGINQHQSIDFDEASDLLFPFGTSTDGFSSDFFFHPPIDSKTDLFFEQKAANSGGKQIIGFEIDGSVTNPVESLDDFDAESILDEELEGIDSIMGTAGSKEAENTQLPVNYVGHSYQGRLGQLMMKSWYKHSTEIGFGINLGTGFGLRSALRHNDDANWWRFPTVDFDQISPRLHNKTPEQNTEGVVEDDDAVKKKAAFSSEKKRKKKKTSVEKTPAEGKGSTETDPNLDPDPVKNRPRLLLKLNCDAVLDAWSGKASPFPDEIFGADGAGTDIHTKLAQIDLFAEGGIREVSVMRYREKRRSRLFSKKIRYQVRKVNADQRPRMKGRFVRKAQCKQQKWTESEMSFG